MPAFTFLAMGKTKPMTYGLYVQILRQKLATLGINPSKFVAHSLCRGGTSWAFTSGANSELIKLQGDWKSHAYQRYLDLPLSVRV